MDLFLSYNLFQQINLLIFVVKLLYNNISNIFGMYIINMKSINAIIGSFAGSSSFMLSLCKYSIRILYMYVIFMQQRRNRLSAQSICAQQHIRHVCNYIYYLYMCIIYVIFESIIICFIRFFFFFCNKMLVVTAHMRAQRQLRAFKS